MWPHDYFVRFLLVEKGQKTTPSNVQIKYDDKWSNLQIQNELLNLYFRSMCFWNLSSAKLIFSQSRWDHKHVSLKKHNLEPFAFVFGLIDDCSWFWFLESFWLSFPSWRLTLWVLRQADFCTESELEMRAKNIEGYPTPNFGPIFSIYS